MATLQHRGMLLALVAVLAVGALGVVAARSLGDDDATATASQDATPTPGERRTVTIDGQVVDTTTSEWMARYREEEAKKPRFDQEINGIRVGPTVANAPAPEACRGLPALTPETIDDPELTREPGYLPAFSEFEFAEADGCAGHAQEFFRHYVVPADPAAADLVTSGEKSWFDVRHGGVFHVIRRRMDQPRLNVSEIAAERWQAGTIAGRPAAIARPIIGSFGPAMVLVWDKDTGILTQVSGDDMALEELTRIAESFWQ